MSEPEALPEGHPEREAWVKRIQAGSLNDLGSHLNHPPQRQDATKLRDPYRLDRPFVIRDRAEAGIDKDASRVR